MKSVRVSCALFKSIRLTDQGVRLLDPRCRFEVCIILNQAGSNRSTHKLPRDFKFLALPVSTVYLCSSTVAGIR